MNAIHFNYSFKLEEGTASPTPPPPPPKMNKYKTNNNYYKIVQRQMKFAIYE